MPVPRTTPRTIPHNANVAEGAAGESLAAGDKVGFAGYPTMVVFKEPGKTPVNQLLWGDWLIQKAGARRQEGFVEVLARGTRGWVKENKIQEKRLLEIVYVDIGQGDGALVVTPNDEHILIDAGQEDNMFRFLRWKYGKFERPWTFKAAVISHPDMDHYKGFQPLFNEPNVRIDTVYHNGLVERVGPKLLGPEEKINQHTYITNVVRDRDQLAGLLAPAEARGRKLYPKLLKTALDSGRVNDIRSLSVDDRHMPGFGPNDPNPVKIDILGPVPEGERDAPRLRRFDTGKTYGPTKNGHSIVLRLSYGRRSMLLGGDLNIPAERYLLEHHTGMKISPHVRPQDEGSAAIVAKARKVFECDVAKACHHGSADFTSLYLQAVNPIATVISSGDNEAHSHPRADAVGTIGKFSRGTRPLIFSTELARSARELVNNPNALRAEAQRAKEAIDKEGLTEEERAKAQKAFDKVWSDITKKLDRSIAVYGAINVRTDGDKVVIAQRVEQPTGQHKKWDVYLLEEGRDKVLRFVSKHEPAVFAKTEPDDEEA